MAYAYDYLVFSGIPIPKRKHRKKIISKTVHYPFKDMKVGDCFHHVFDDSDVPTHICKKFVSSCMNQNRQTEKKFIVRNIYSDNGVLIAVGCWRVK